VKLTARGRTVIGVALIALMWAFLVACFLIGQDLAEARRGGSPDSGLIPPRVCQEDEGCWDCATMGNNVCGRP
jgi:hypothetical protein